MVNATNAGAMSVWHVCCMFVYLCISDLLTCDVMSMNFTNTILFEFTYEKLSKNIFQRKKKPFHFDTFENDLK